MLNCSGATQEWNNKGKRALDSLPKKDTKGYVHALEG